MFELKTFGTKWELRFDDCKFIGPFEEVIRFAILNLGFEADELELGVSNMMVSDNSIAHFGVNRTFIYSYSLEKVA